MVDKKNQKRSFCPDEIATAIHQALERDLSPLLHEYSGPGAAHHVAIKAQIEQFGKKYCSPTQDKERLTAECFEGFKKTNKHMQSVNAAIEEEISTMGARLNIQAGDSPLSKLLRRMRSICYHVLGEFEFDDVIRHCRHSSGSTVGVPFRDTSTERKFTFPISSTPRAAKLFSYYLEHDSCLKAEIRQHNRCTPTVKHLDWLMFDLVEGSRASTVDKTTDKRRMICVEPTANMFLQLGIMEYMYDLLKKVGLDVESLPERHAHLAKLASMTGLNATIDFASASDCVSYELLRYILPYSWFAIIDQVRCSSTSLGDEQVDLHMVSSMGNATTFPLETLVFWALGQATLYQDSDTRLFPKRKDYRRVSVFGDDCVVETGHAACFMQNAQNVGFLVNEEKSFYSEGPGFRESCGGDFVRGYPVRPFTIRAPSQMRDSGLEPWLYIIMNRLTKKYIQYFGNLSYVYEKEFFKLIAQLFKEYKLKLRFVPPGYPDDSGLQSTDFYRILDYGFTPAKISRSSHGSYRFNYKRFVYSSEYYSWNERLRYNAKLKRFATDIGDFGVSHRCSTTHLGKAPRELKHSYRNKDNGGYVDAVGYTSHWFVPNLTRRITNLNQLALAKRGSRHNAATTFFMLSNCANTSEGNINDVPPKHLFSQSGRYSD